MFRKCLLIVGCIQKFKIHILLFFLSALLCTSFIFQENNAQDNRILSFIVDPNKQDLKLYWKDNKGEVLKNFANLQKFLENNKQHLVFAMNAGMYKKDNTPQGLYIENHRLLAPLDTMSGAGNFYMKPNGVFYLTDENKGYVCQTANFKLNEHIKYATQSGPLLLIDGQIHAAFKDGSSNLNIRNGVGILPDGKIVFAMSKEEINFYDFAIYFKNMGCKNALYLDGFVSRMYLPEKNWKQLDGNFGAMIGVTEEIK